MCLFEVDIRFSRMQRVGHLSGHENMRILFDEAVQLARSVEHTHV